MARVEVSFFSTGNRSQEGGSMPVARGSGMVTEVLSTDGGAAVTASSAVGTDVAFARVWSDADVWVVSGAQPSAIVPEPGASGAGWRVPAGVPVDLALESGDRIAVVAIA